jgi:hypothetical protein
MLCLFKVDLAADWFVAMNLLTQKKNKIKLIKTDIYVIYICVSALPNRL